MCSRAFPRTHESSNCRSVEGGPSMDWPVNRLIIYLLSSLRFPTKMETHIQLYFFWLPFHVFFLVGKAWQQVAASQWIASQFNQPVHGEGEIISKYSTTLKMICYFDFLENHLWSPHRIQLLPVHARHRNDINGAWNPKKGWFETSQFPFWLLVGSGEFEITFSNLPLSIFIRKEKTNLIIWRVSDVANSSSTRGDKERRLSIVASFKIRRDGKVSVWRQFSIIAAWLRERWAPDCPFKKGLFEE